MTAAKHSHYSRDVSHLDSVDIYRVIDLFGVQHAALQHALKKVMAAGQRGAKNEAQDVQEAIDSLTRWQAMRDEDAAVMARARQEAAFAEAFPVISGLRLKSPDCWCEDCDVKANGGMRSRMSLCPSCGDKRCPASSNHGNDCAAKPYEACAVEGFGIIGKPYDAELLKVGGTD